MSETNKTRAPLPIWSHEGAAIAGAAKLMEAEAQTWAEGFAVNNGGKLEWTKEHEWAHVRYAKLMNSALALRGIVARLEKKIAKEADKK